MTSSILDVITHYQRSIERSAHDEVRLLHCIDKLYKLPVTVEHLQATGVGKTVNSLRKYDKEVGIAAKALVAKWKAMVAAEEKDTESDDNVKRNSYYDDDRGNDSNQNRKSNTDYANNTLSSSSSLATTSHSNKNNNNTTNGNNHHSTPSSNKSHSNRNLEDYSKKRKLECDKTNTERGNHHRKHHKKSKTDHDHNDLNSNHSSKYNDVDEKKYKCEIEPTSNGIKKEFKVEDYENLQEIKSERIEENFEILEEDDQSGTEYDDEGEKLVIDVKDKTEEQSDTDDSDNDAENFETTINNNNQQHVDSKEEIHRNKYDKKYRASKSESSTKESKERHSKKGTSSHHHNHHKSKHRDEKKSRHRDKESKSISLSSHHKAKEESRRHHKEKQTSEKSSPEQRRHCHGNTTDGSNSSSKATSSNEKHKRKSSNDSDSKLLSPPLSKPKVSKVTHEGIDSSMGKSFEEALGMLNTPSGSKSFSKSKSKVSNTNSSSSSTDNNFAKPSSSQSSSSKLNNTPDLLSSTSKLTPLDPSIALELPVISPNYKPLPLNPTVMDCVYNNRPQRKPLTDEEALAAGVSSKTIRTKVFSGSKPGQLQHVPSLFDLCIWVLQRNIDGLEYTGGVPFDVLKPVLDLASPDQLLNFEYYNPYLIEDTEALWEKICHRQCKGIKRQEMETWRDMYLRCQEERAIRLSKLTENIKQSQSQQQIIQPTKKTQLAFIDSMVKPPRNIQRKQELFGTSHKKVTTPASRVASLSNLAPNITKAPIRINPNEKDTAQANAHSRPKKAPLMQKTLQLMKGRFKR